MSGIPAVDVGMFTDLDGLTMAARYFLEQMFVHATFSLFFRAYPPRRGFYITAGLADALSYLQHLAFRSSAITYLRNTGLFADDFLEYLGGVRFPGEVRAIPEGRVMFANEPLIEVTAPIIEARLAETLRLNYHLVAPLNGQALRGCRGGGEHRSLSPHGGVRHVQVRAPARRSPRSGRAWRLTASPRTRPLIS